MADRPTEPLPEVIGDPVRMRREPPRIPQDHFQWISELRRMTYDVTDAVRPR